MVIDARGNRLLLRRVLNDETVLLDLIADVLAISEDILWAVDINHGGAALLIGLLLDHGQPMACLTGLAVHQASAGYRWQGKTDAKDAFVIADLGRLRPGPTVDRLPDPGRDPPQRRQAHRNLAQEPQGQELLGHRRDRRRHDRVRHSGPPRRLRRPGPGPT